MQSFFTSMYKGKENNVMQKNLFKHDLEQKCIFKVPENCEAMQANLVCYPMELS